MKNFTKKIAREVKYFAVMNIYGDGTLLSSYCIVIISLVNKTIQFNLKHMSLEFQMSLQNVENRI